MLAAPERFWQSLGLTRALFAALAPARFFEATVLSQGRAVSGAGHPGGPVVAKVWALEHMDEDSEWYKFGSCKPTASCAVALPG